MPNIFEMRRGPACTLHANGGMRLPSRAPLSGAWHRWELRALPHWSEGPYSDRLKLIVKRYLEDGTLDAKGIVLMRAYLRYCINLPIWKETYKLDDLRASVNQIEETEDIQAWIAEARRAGIEPLHR